MFESIMSRINPDDCLKIINDIFFKIFSYYVDKYISNNSDIELELNLQLSLSNIVKILNEYYNKNENQNKLFSNYLNKIIELIPISSITLNCDILNSILVIKTNKNENRPMIVTKLDVYYKILYLIKDFIKNIQSNISELNKLPTYRLFKSILSYLNSIFLDNNNLEIYNNENLKKIFNVLDILFEALYWLEPELIETKPRIILDFEKEIFDFLEKIPIESYIIYDYIVDKIIIDYKNPHSESICHRGLEFFENKICNEKSNFGLKKEEKDLFKKIVEKLIEIINLRNNNEVVESLIDSCIDKNNLKEGIAFDQYIGIFIKSADKICDNFLKYKQSNEDENKKEIINNIYEVFSLILDLLETIFKQSIDGYKEINEIYLPIITAVYQQIEIESIKFTLNKLLFYILLILGDEDKDIYGRLEEKIIKVIKLCCDISYVNSNFNNDNSSSPSLNEICIKELIEICRYKSNEEILNKIKNDDIKIDKDKYINNSIKVAKICTTILIEKMIKLLKNFIEDENKSDGNDSLNSSRIQEISILLQNIKALELFPDIDVIEKKEENKIEGTTTFDIISKSKKIHLFYLQPILNDLIFTKEENLKSIIKEIFYEINNFIGLHKLIDFSKEVII